MAELAIKSANAAGLSEDAVYCHAHTPAASGFPDRPEWLVTDNYETGLGSLIFNTETKVWAWRNPLDGDDHILKGGFEEAKESASMFFTG